MAAVGRNQQKKSAIFFHVGKPLSCRLDPQAVRFMALSAMHLLATLVRLFLFECVRALVER